MRKLTLLTAAAFGGLSVALGAFGTHLLRDLVDPKTRAMEWWNTSTDYMMFHALAIFGLGLLMARHTDSVPLRVVFWLWVVGVFIFSGMLMTMTIGNAQGLDYRILGAVVPLGGGALIIGWIVFFITLAQIIDDSPTQSSSRKSRS